MAHNRENCTTVYGCEEGMIFGPTVFWCCHGWEIVSNDYASLDVDNMVRVDVCFQCRMVETCWMIRKFASYD